MTDITTTPKDRKLAARLSRMVAEIAPGLDANLSLKLWDGSRLPLGSKVTSELAISVSDPGVISSILRKPGLDRVIRHYLHGQLDFEGGTLIDIGEQLAFKGSRSALKEVGKLRLASTFLPFLMVKPTKPEAGRGFGDNETGTDSAKRDEKGYIQFHYDVSNEFYELFLDERMIYTCGYFRDWNNSLDQAQKDKLDMICRKLRLKPGERMLDIGCGWGGLICHAAEHFGVEAVGVTLSQEQHDKALETIALKGLKDRVSVELKDYRDMTGPFDKISSIGMYEAIGVAQIPEYVAKVRDLLTPDGIFLNHGVTRRAKKKKKRFVDRSEQRALVRYVFPGSELDDIGNTLQKLEEGGFEVHDVESWREHYALTIRHWCDRLHANKDAAIEIAGEEIFRIWAAYLAGTSLAFRRGGMNIYQTVASKRSRGPSPLPATREDLYRDT